MKRFFVLFLAAMLLVSAAVMSVNATIKFDAADVTYVDCDDFDGAKYGTLVASATGDMDEISDYYGEIGSTLYNLASGGTSFCVKTDAYVWYDFVAPQDGTYTFALEYVARIGGADRGVNVVIDPSSLDQSEQTFLLLDPCDDNDDPSKAVFEVDLTAGTHQLYIAVCTGFDDSTLKSCDFYGYEVYFTREAAPVVEETPTEEVPAEETPAEAPAEEAPATDIAPAPVAPATADAGIVAAAAIMAIAAGVVLSKKH